ncbi:hypothetical protein QZH41_008643 [Actinostola sp. cb2023]|nr:hypothetical protein QZH41_008643 [Actinostola sp. cb2023]
MSLRQINSLHRKSNLQVIRWLQRRNVLANPLYCGTCGRDMDIVQRGRQHIDGYVWRCRGCSKKRSLRTNSFFAHFPKIKLADAVTMLYFWSEDDGQRKTATKVGISRNLVSKFYWKVGEVCTAYLDRYPVIPFGGPNCVVQCDESKFCHKRKYNRGRRPRDAWVFGVISTEYQPARGYYQVVNGRDRATLLPILELCLNPGSIVHSDDWAAYGNLHRLLPNHVAEHRIVNHSLNFVDPVTGVHTQNMESKWNELKRKIKEMKGIAGDRLQSYLNERMWREWIGGEQVLTNFWTTLSLMYPNVPV